MNTAAKIASLTARRDDVYEEAFRIADAEPFRAAEELAYNGLLEIMAGMNEYLEFLEGEAHDKHNRKTSCRKQFVFA